MTSALFIVAPAGKPARTYRSAWRAAQALLDARGATQPISVLVDGRWQRPVSQPELRRIGEAVREQRARRTAGER
jgi:hypothetical protein